MATRALRMLTAAMLICSGCSSEDKKPSPKLEDDAAAPRVVNAKKRSARWLFERLPKRQGKRATRCGANPETFINSIHAGITGRGFFLLNLRGTVNLDSLACILEVPKGALNMFEAVGFVELPGVGLKIAFPKSAQVESVPVPTRYGLSLSATLWPKRNKTELSVWFDGQRGAWELVFPSDEQATRALANLQQVYAALEAEDLRHWSRDLRRYGIEFREHKAALEPHKKGTALSIPFSDLYVGAAIASALFRQTRTADDAMRPTLGPRDLVLIARPGLAPPPSIGDMILYRCPKREDGCLGRIQAPAGKDAWSVSNENPESRAAVRQVPYDSWLGTALLAAKDPRTMKLKWIAPLTP